MAARLWLAAVAGTVFYGLTGLIWTHHLLPGGFGALARRLIGRLRR